MVEMWSPGQATAAHGFLAKAKLAKEEAVIDPRIETLDKADDQNKCLVSYRYSVHTNIRNLSSVFEYEYAEYYSLFASICIFVALYTFGRNLNAVILSFGQHPTRRIREGRIDPVNL